MPVPYDEIRWIKDTLVRIEERLMKLEKRFDRSQEIQLNHIESVHKYFSIHDAELVDVFQRLMNIELKFFPHLAGDMDNLDRVLGPGDEQAFNLLDNRHFSKDAPKKT